MTELERQRQRIAPDGDAQRSAVRIVPRRGALEHEDIPQRLWLVAQYFRLLALLTGVGIPLTVALMFISARPALQHAMQPLRERPWLLLLPLITAVSLYSIGTRLLRRERLAAIVAFALLLVPVISAAAGRGTGMVTLVLSAVSAIALASVWRSLR